MKKLLFPLLTILCFFTLSAQDTSFYDYGWLKMQNKGADYQTIIDTANFYYSDTSQQSRINNYHQFARWNFFWKNRISSTPEEIAQNIKGSFSHHAKAASGLYGQTLCDTNHSASNWESWGFNTHPFDKEGNQTSISGMGVMWCVKIDTADHNLQTIYAGSPLGGLWKTTNQGNSWFNVTDQIKLPALGISDIDIDPRNNQHLLIATGISWSLNAPGAGVLESFDAGNTWQTTGLKNHAPIKLNLNKYVEEVHFHPTDSMKYFALVDSVLKISIDKGITWDSVIFNAGDTNVVNYLKFHPTNPDTMYIATKGKKAEVYRSYDGGANWTAITTNIFLYSKRNQFGVDVNPLHPDNVYIVVQMVSNKITSFKSTNNGNTWSSVFQNEFDTYFRGKKDVFMVSPTNDVNQIFGGKLPAYRKIGTYRVSQASGLYHPDVRGGDYVNGLAAIATDGGISISFNDGKNWINKYDSLNVQQSYGHDVDKDYTYLLSGMQDIGGYRYDINTKTWLSTHGSDGAIPTISKTTPSIGITGVFCGGDGCNFQVFRYTHHGVNYQKRTNMPIQWQEPAYRPFTELHDGRIFTAMEDVFKVNGYGSSYIKLTDFDGTGFKGDTINDYIVALAVSPADTNMMVAGFALPSWRRDEGNLPCNTIGCHQKKLLVSLDQGITWVDRTKDNLGKGILIEWSAISDIIISPTDAGKIWVSLGGYSLDNGIPAKIYFSPDTGHTWTNISNNLPNYPAHSIVYQENSNDRIFIATDAGVYTKDASSTEWECYNNNLPFAYCVDLDVNNCGGALTISTQGRGIWKSPLPPNRLKGNLVWDGVRNVGSDLIVEDTLTITGRVEMAVGTKITVERGAKLIIDGGTITSSHCINGLWQGIELLGNTNAEQWGNFMSPNFAHGYLQLINGATIEHAEVGIYAGKYGSSGYAGGLIRTNGITSNKSAIKNCRKGIVITPYAKHNKSKYRHTDFINDGTFTDPLNNEPLLTESHVSIDGVTIVGHEFAYVSFQNNNPALTNAARGIGIELTGRRIGTTINSFIEESSFENLNYGMKLGNMASGVGNDIENNSFTKNQRGIYILSGYSMDIHNNSFTVDDADENQDTYAMMTAGLSSFDIRNNSIEGSTLSSEGAHHTYGFIIENSSAGGGILFNNTVGESSKNLEIGVQAQGDNENLTIRCNDFTNAGENPSSITVYNYTYYSNGFPFIIPAELKDQGHPNCITQGQQIGDPSAAAGNKFLASCNGTEEEIAMESGLQFKYYWHSNDKDLMPTTMPDCSDPNWNTNLNLYVDCGVNEQQLSCSDLYAPPSGGGDDQDGEITFRKKGTTAKSGKDSIDVAAYENWYLRLKAKKEALEGRANGNSSEAALIQVIANAVTQSTSTSVATQSLLSASPLSDKVLLTTIEEWAGNANSSLQLVLTENVPLSKEVWTALNAKGLSAAWSQHLNNSPNLHLLRDSLVSINRRFRFAKKELQLAEVKVYRALMADSSFKAAESLLDTSLLSASLRLLAKDHVNQAAWNKATTLLSKLNGYAFDGELKQNQAFVNLYTQLIPIYQNTKVGSGLTEKASEVQNILQEPRGQLNDEVEALHQSFTKQFTHHPISKRAGKHTEKNGTILLNKELKRFVLYPNPNAGTATVEYELQGDHAALWQVFDVNGRLVIETSLAVGIQQKQLEMNQLNNGVYHFVVSLKGKRLYNGKMVITK